MNLTALFLQPILNATLQFVIQLLQEVAPEAAADVKDFFEGVAGLSGDIISGDLTLAEFLDSIKIRANLLKERGETIAIEVQANAEKYPAKIAGVLTGLIGNVVGPLEKLAGL